MNPYAPPRNRVIGALVLALAACGGAARPPANDPCAIKPLPAVVAGAPRVTFEGNRAFSADELRAVMSFGRGLPDTDLENDVEALTRFYYDHGFFGVKVVVPTATEQEVRVAIEEGPRYRLRSLTFKDRGQRLGAEARAHLVAQRGQWIRRCALLPELQRLRDAYKAAGFGNAEIEPETELSPNEGAADIVVDVKPGEKGPELKFTPPHHPSYYTCSGAVIDLGAARGCTSSETPAHTIEPPPLDPRSVEVHLDGGDGWTERDHVHDLVLVVKNTARQFVRFRFEEGCGEHGQWATANYLSTGVAADTASWDGCPSFTIAGCKADVYDVEIPPGGELRRSLAFFPSRSVTRTQCHQTLEPLPAGTYEVRAITPIPIANGGWLTASTSMQVR